MSQVQGAPKVAVRFDEDVEYVDRTLVTASWWDRYVLKAGVYNGEWVNIDYTTWTGTSINFDPTRDRPYYLAFQVPATLVESHRVNRVFQHSSVENTEPMKDATISRTMYAYEVWGRDGTINLDRGLLGGKLVAA